MLSEKFKTSKEFYSFINFILNMIKEKDGFILDFFNVNEHSELNSNLYKVLRSNCFLSQQQNLTFKLLEKDGELDSINFNDCLSIISSYVPGDYMNEDKNDFSLDEINYILSLLLEKDEIFRNDFLAEIDTSFDDDGINLDYLSNFVPILEIPIINTQENIFEISSKQINLLQEKIDDIYALFETPVNENDIKLVKNILESMESFIKDIQENYKKVYLFL